MNDTDFLLAYHYYYYYQYYYCYYYYWDRLIVYSLSCLLGVWVTRV